MIRFVLHVLATALGFWVASKLMPHGVRVDNLTNLLEAGLLLGIINALVRPILILLTLPLTILTLGLWLLVVNAVTVWLVTLFLRGVHIHGALHFILTAIVISLTSWAVGGLIGRTSSGRRI